MYVGGRWRWEICVCLRACWDWGGGGGVLIMLLFSPCSLTHHIRLLCGLLRCIVGSGAGQGFLPTQAGWTPPSFL